MKALNPSNAIRQCVACKLGKGSTGWYRFAEIAYIESTSKGSPCTYAEIMMQQMYNESQGCFHKVNLYMQYSDKAKMTTVGQNNFILQKVRLVRKDNIIYLDVYSQGRSNETRILLYIPIEIYITSAKCVDPYLVPENSDGEVVVCSVDLANNI